tara:strand:- start:19 stop:966 length:948 start_codon:yes stop_codon:yes gene_type:complete
MNNKYGVENGETVYMDTGFEHPRTYDFIRNCNKRFESQITFLRGDFSLPHGAGVGYNVITVDDIGCDGKPMAEMMQKYGVPYIGGMFCTDRMKLKPFKKYCDNKYGKSNYETWLGIRIDEPKRLVGDNKKKELSAYKQLKSDGLSDDLISELYVSARADIEKLDEAEVSQLSKDLLKKRILDLEKSGIHYLAEISDFEKQDVLEWWSMEDFDLGIPEQLGNCVFCPKKSDLKLAAAQRDEPELYSNWLDMLYSDSVRVDDKTGHWSKMYRGKQSLEQLIATFDGSTGEEIKARIRGGKMIDTNSCSESCEVFNLE